MTNIQFDCPHCHQAAATPARMDIKFGGLVTFACLQCEGRVIFFHLSADGSNPHVLAVDPSVERLGGKAKRQHIRHQARQYLIENNLLCLYESALSAAMKDRGWDLTPDNLETIRRVIREGADALDRDESLIGDDEVAAFLQSL